MVTYAANLSNVQEVADEMQVIAGKINDMVTTLDNQQTVNLSEWVGNAADAYHQAQQVWDAAAHDMSVQASNAQNSLSNITNAYANAESQGLGLWQS